MDFPHIPLPTHVHSYGRWGPLNLGRVHAFTLAGPASGTWTGANLAIYIPFSIPWPYPVNRMFWCNGATVTSNVDVGIYSAGGVKLYSAGSTADTTASDLQYVTPGTPFVLAPGAYYWGYVNSGTAGAITGNVVTAVMSQAMGCQQQATALPLPATATFAASTHTLYPLVGMTRTTTSF